MTKALHEALRTRWQSGAHDSKAAMARALDMPGSTLKTWLGAEVGTKRYRNEERDDALRKALGLSAEKQPQAYSGPADLPGYATPPAISGPTSERSFDPEQAIAKQARRFKKKERRAQEKKRQTVRFKSGPVCLFFVGDQHIGNAGTDVERVFTEQEIMLSTPGGYVWQMGDVVDNFIVGRLKRQNMKPSASVREQWDLAKHYLSRFGERHVAFTAGNHSQWTAQVAGVDYVREICPDGILYDGHEVKAEVSVGAASYNFWARHKWRGNSIYNPTHGMERAARFDSQDYDVYVGAHTHDGSLYREFILNGQRKAAVQLGAYKQHDSYAKAQGFPGTDGSTACALILHDDGSFHGMADLKAARRFMRAVHG